ncbi:hypothetical protein B0H14DRAFT_3637620 [Mycena olivaceomarginata]|nr:hypothetical protein B0H14DRAFT_3637620 [Mycena olivaceomarginata]
MDLYAILNLAPGASPAEIKAVYHRALLAAHPDKNNAAQSAPEIAAIKDAYRVLSLPALCAKAKAHQDPRSAQVISLADFAEQGADLVGDLAQPSFSACRLPIIRLLAVCHKPLSPPPFNGQFSSGFSTPYVFRALLGLLIHTLLYSPSAAEAATAAPAALLTSHALYLTAYTCPYNGYHEMGPVPRHHTVLKLVRVFSLSSVTQ